MLAATVTLGTLNLLLVVYVFRRGAAGALAWSLAILLSILLGGAIGMQLRGLEPHAGPESVALLAPAPVAGEQPGAGAAESEAKAPSRAVVEPTPEEAGPGDTSTAAPAAAQETEGGAGDTTQAEATEATTEPEAPEEPAEPEPPPPPPHAAEIQTIAGEIAKAAEAGDWKQMRERYEAALDLDPNSEVLQSAWEGAEAVRDQRLAAYRAEAFAVFKERKRCTDPKELLRVWAMRQSAARGEPQYGLVKGAAKWLEHCRGKIMETLLRKIAHEGAAGRQALVEPLRERLHGQGQPVKVSLEGRRDTTLRITGGTFDADSAAALLDSGLREELAKLGFVKVTFARYTKRHRFAIEAERTADILLSELKGMGLERPFEVEAP